MSEIEFADPQPEQVDELPPLPGSTAPLAIGQERSLRLVDDVVGENEHHLDELPAEARDALDFVLVDSIEDVFAAAFGSNRHSHSNGRMQPATSRR